MPMDGDDEKLIRREGTISILMHKVKNDDYLADLVLVLPILMSQEHSRIHKISDRYSCATKFNGRKVRWDDIIPGQECLKTARLIFKKDSNTETEAERAHARTGSEAIDRRFSQDMTRLEFHQEIVERLVDIIAGQSCALRLATMQSVDHDELYICVSIDDNQFVERVADSEGYPAEVRRDEYVALSAEANKTYEIPVIDGKETRAWTNFRLRHGSKFEPFTYIDSLRIMEARISHFISLHDMIAAGVVESYFNVHKWDQLAALNTKKERFSALKSMYLIPDYEDMDMKRDYFGEHVTFYFHWFSFYTWKLIVPAILGIIVWFRRYLETPIYRRTLQDAFAVFIALWSAYLCEAYSRKAVQSAARWGTRKPDTGGGVRPDYKPEVMYATARWKRIGAILAMLFLVLIISAILITQLYRHTMIHSPDKVWLTHIIHIYSNEETAVNAGAKIGALLITLQIKLIDVIWGKIAKWLTNKENHKTQYRWTKSYVVKTVFVKFFNSMYPFVYIAFVKEYVEGCRLLPMDKINLTEDDMLRQELLGCIPGLATAIATFFFVHLFLRLANVLIAVLKAQWRIRTDKSKPGVVSADYTYIQLQSKMDPYTDEMLVDDYMSAIVQFGIVTCFSVVLPVLTVVAFLSNLLEFRLIAFRMSYILKRPHPLTADGSGSWSDVFKGISYLAIGINCGLVIFAMLPFKAVDQKWQFMIFVAAEHMLILLKLAVETAFGGASREIEVADDVNDEVLLKMFGGSFKPMNFKRDQFGTQGAIRCSIDGSNWHQAYYHHDLIGYSPIITPREI